MSAGKAIFNKLSTTTAITNLVSTRIFPVLNPEQDVFPVIIYDVQASKQDHSYAGATGPRIDTVEIVSVTQRVDPGEPEYASVDVLCKTVKDVLDGAGKYGEMWGDQEVQDVSFETEDDEVTTIGDDKGRLFYVKAQKYSVTTR